MWRYILRRLSFWLVRPPPDTLCSSDLVVSMRLGPAPSKLMIVAHPDDESLFAGEALTSTRGWLVVCVTHASNLERRREFTSAMSSIRVDYTMLDHADDLRNGRFNGRLVEQLSALLAEYSYDLVVTHNAAGEYGHPQHRALHRIVRQLVADRPLYVFDIAWTAWPRMSGAKRALLAHYAGQQRSIRHRWFLASRERLRRIH